MTDLEIAEKYQPERIESIAKKLNIDEKYVEPYGKYKAKITAPYNHNPDGKLILVTAINPTPYGEGKTTVSIGLADGLSLIGKKACLALREPSLGPVFGIKGGATGGGYSQVVPMADINLHFNGDFHAITSANNMLAALIDNHIKQGNELKIDKVVWRRCLDVNDRALRMVEVALGGEVNGVPREDGFDITAASEIMAAFCLAKDLEDLKRRLGNLIVGYSADGAEITARDLKAENAMTILLSEALYPNLVQTLQGTPAFIHGGPFANIAHGCNTVIATKTAMTYADYTVTEAGFGAELGAEKFLDIKCRKEKLKPSAIVLVATARALKYNGGIDKSAINNENTEALTKGAANLKGHIENLKKYGVPVVVAINRFTTDTADEIKIIKDAALSLGVTAVVTNGWAEGGRGCIELAENVVRMSNKKSVLKLLYDDEMSVKDKIITVATKIYGAGRVLFSSEAEEKIKYIDGNEKYSKFPVCIAKTQYSFSADQTLLGRPLDFDFSVRDVKISAGAEFIVVVAGKIMLMPGLSKSPAAVKMTIDKDRVITGLF